MSNKEIQFKGRCRVLADDASFACGADLSLLKRNADRGYFYRVGGKAVEPAEAFRRAGFNYARLRLFHTPSLRGAQVNDLPYTLALAKELKGKGFRFLLNLHYSDTWADPGKQYLPRAWEGLAFEALEKAVYEYTREVLRAFVKAQATPEIVQVGNEITSGMLWDHGKVAEAHDCSTFQWVRRPCANHTEAWDRLEKLLTAGISGVRDAAGEGTRVMVHIDRGGDLETSRWFFDNLHSRVVDFDVIGQSYYPFWHGMPEDLERTLHAMAALYGKDLYVVETAYPWKHHPAYREVLRDYPEVWDRLSGRYPLSPEGQRRFFEEVVEIARGVAGGRGKGVFYWAPEWIAPPAGMDEEGDAPPCWARALFDDRGEALPAFEVFKQAEKPTPARRIAGVGTAVRPMPQAETQAKVPERK